METVKSSITAKIAHDCNTDGKICFDYILQREFSQWNRQQQSELIHSIVAGYDIPAEYFIKQFDEEINREIWVVVDGKQRLSAIFDFIDNKYALSKKTPSVRLGKTTYEIAGKKFKNLPEPVREQFLMKPLDIKYLMDYSEDELEEQFYRLNNGTTFTKQQKAVVLLGGELVEKLKPLVLHEIWKRANISTAKRRHGGITEIILKLLMILTDYDYGCDMNMSRICKFAEYYSGNYSDSEISQCLEFLDKLNRVIPNTEQCDEFLTPVNIPTLFRHLVEYSKREGEQITADTMLDEQFYSEFIEEFISDTENGYLDFCGVRSSNRDKIEGRLNKLNSELDIYISETVTVSEEFNEMEEEYKNGNGNGKNTGGEEDLWKDELQEVVQPEQPSVHELHRVRENMLSGEILEHIGTDGFSPSSEAGGRNSDNSPLIQGSEGCPNNGEATGTVT